MNINEIEQGMINVMDDTVKRLIATRSFNNRERTRLMLNDLTKFFYITYKEHKTLQVWSKPNDHDDTINGWLFDFAVCNGRTENDIDIVWVALESEWNADFNEIKYDFYKLIQSRALLRVMIFQSEDVNQTITDLIGIVSASQMTMPGDRYLFAGWSWGDKIGCKFQSHVRE